MKPSHLQIWSSSTLLFFLLLSGCSKEEENPADTAEAYLSEWQQQNYAGMYDKLTPDSRSKLTGDEFVERYTKIYDGIEAKNLIITSNPKTDLPLDKNVTELSFNYHVAMDTVAGPVSFDHQLKLVKSVVEKEEKWLVAWGPSLIFPQLGEGDKVKVQTAKGARGEILDRKGNGLAINGSMPQVGIVPGKLGDAGEDVKAKLAEKLNISVEEINRKLSASWVKPDLFVPVAVVPKAEADLYKDMPGVAVQNKKLRVYPYADAAAHLTGYIGEINAEQLERLKDQGYAAGDWIGKAGLEQVYEEQLRGKRGVTVSVVDAGGEVKEVLAETKASNGATIQLTIDAGLQQKIYGEVRQDAASAAAIDPVSGDILSLISSPSYDPNAFQQGLSSEQYNKWNDDPRHPFLNRFSKSYVPGSVFKIMTAAIGMDNELLNPNETKQIDGLTWTKDSSWGSYFVTRVHSVGQVNLLTALIHSDNIYFARAALNIGTELFTKEAAKYGIGEQLPVPYPFSKSQLSNKGIQNEIQLADTGYGQGQVTMTSLHAALVFSALVNQGDIVSPRLIMENGESRPPVIWKKQAMSPESAGVLKEHLVEAVTHPAGVGHGTYIPGASIAGKTGTAELKAAKGADGLENGWFIGFDAKKPDLLLSVMIEDVKGRGGSGYVTKKVKPVFQYASTR